MTEPSAQGDARAEVVALRRLADEHADCPEADWQRIARACSLTADVLAQDAALVERVARELYEGIVGPGRWDATTEEARDSRRVTARAALAAMLQKEPAEPPTGSARSRYTGEWQTPRKEPE